MNATLSISAHTRRKPGLNAEIARKREKVRVELVLARMCRDLERIVERNIVAEADASTLKDATLDLVV